MKQSGYGENYLDTWLVDFVTNMASFSLCLGHIV